MHANETLEQKALLAASGETTLTESERRQTECWSREVDALTRRVYAALNDGAPGAITVAELRPETRRAIARQRVRFRRLRLVRGLAAAALLLLMAGGAFHLHIQREEQRDLQRLGNVLFLLEPVDDDGLDGLVAQDRVTLETLADQLGRLQAARY